MAFTLSRSMNTSSMTRHSHSEEQLAAFTILVVEDELMVRLPIAEYLRDCGYHVLEAGSAAEAIAAVDAAGSVSAVFSDVRMPGKMNGLELARWFRTNHPRVPVLLTSGYIPNLSVQIDELVGSKLIEKPYSQAQVAGRIEALLAAART